MKKFFKWVLMIFGGIFLLGIIVSIFGGTEVEEVSKGSGTKQEQKKEEEKVYKIGDTVRVDGLELTITSAKYTNPAPYSEVKNGKVLTIEVQVNNTSDTQKLIDSTEFALYDTNGNKLGEYFGYDELAISGDLNKGKKLAGKLYYDVPQAEKYELIYTPSFSLDGKEIKFEIVPQQ
jgi:Domain of unknown function (DUF4352)